LKIPTFTTTYIYVLCKLAINYLNNRFVVLLSNYQSTQHAVSNAEKLIKKHDHKGNKVSRGFKLNDLVSVKIPQIDTSSGENPWHGG